MSVTKPSSHPRVILSGFADEAANHKTPVEQFVAFAALGLQYYSIRFVDLGDGVKNVMNLSVSDIQKLREYQNEYQMNVSSIGSPIGKVKLVDVDDGTKNRFVPFAEYLSTEVRRACELAHAFESKLIRGFSFYHPRGADPKPHIPQVVDQLGQIAEMCHRSDLTYGVEVEPNLVGENGYLLTEIWKQVSHPALTMVYDAANLIVQGFSAAELLEQFRLMLPGLGWVHIKDYHAPVHEKGQLVDEESLHHFVPCTLGDSGHEAIFRALRPALPELKANLKRRGIAGVFVDLEPHVKGGGQFGGFSGPDGLGVALRELCRALDYADIDYHLRNFDDVCVARGF